MKYKGKKLCVKCKSAYHPDQYATCWGCWAKQPANTINKYKDPKYSGKSIEGWESQKDFEEANS